MRVVAIHYAGWAWTVKGNQTLYLCFECIHWGRDQFNTPRQLRVSHCCDSYRVTVTVSISRLEMIVIEIDLAQ